jgi:hypothetical protein
MTGVKRMRRWMNLVAVLMGSHTLSRSERRMREVMDSSGSEGERMVCES